jgi:hypothetical protein
MQSWLELVRLASSWDLCLSWPPEAGDREKNRALMSLHCASEARTEKRTFLSWYHFPAGWAGFAELVMWSNICATRGVGVTWLGFGLRSGSCVILPRRFSGSPSISSSRRRKGLIDVWYMNQSCNSQFFYVERVSGRNRSPEINLYYLDCLFPISFAPGPRREWMRGYLLSIDNDRWKPGSYICCIIRSNDALTMTTPQLCTSYNLPHTYYEIARGSGKVGTCLTVFFVFFCAWPR